MTTAERLRANLDRALANYCCAGGAALTITTLAPLAGSTRWTLGRLGGHTRVSTLQRIAGALGCTVADLVADVESTTPVDLSDRLWILYDGRACVGFTDDATVLVSCDDDEEARTYAGNYGDMACYSYRVEKVQGKKPDELMDERWEWNWLANEGFSLGRVLGAKDYEVVVTGIGLKDWPDDRP